jgi:hypothetical protein
MSSIKSLVGYKQREEIKGMVEEQEVDITAV